MSVHSKGHVLPKPGPRPRHSSVVFDVDETCPGGLVGGDDDPKLMVKPHNRDARFIDRPGPPVLGKGQSFGASSFVMPPTPLPPPSPSTLGKCNIIPTDERVAEIIEGIGRALKQRGAVGLAGLARNFRINDFNKSGTLDRDELRKCLRMCKLDLDVNDFEVLFRHLDSSDDGQVDYDEFLTAVRGPLPSVRKRLIVDIFLAIDERVSEGRKGRADGKLTIDDLSELFDGKNHPEVKAGRLNASAALAEMVTSFEGKNGNRDGEVTLKEWTSYYGDLSASFENDDHFAAMMMGAWPAIFDPKGAAKGFKVLKPPVPQRDIDNLEALLRRSITSRSTASSETKALEKVFKEFDKDNSKTIGFEEFIVAMERFGLCTAADSRTDVSGVTLEAVRALFDRYDIDGEGDLSFKEFERGLFGNEAPKRGDKAVGAPPPPVLTSLALPSERGLGTRPPPPAGAMEHAQHGIHNYTKGRGGMLNGGLNMGVERPVFAPAAPFPRATGVDLRHTIGSSAGPTPFGKASGTTHGFNQSSGIFR